MFHIIEWSNEEIGALLAYKHRGYSFAKIASLLGKSRSAVGNKLHRLAKAGLTGEPGRGKILDDRQKRREKL